MNALKNVTMELGGHFNRKGYGPSVFLYLEGDYVVHRYKANRWQEPKETIWVFAGCLLEEVEGYTPPDEEGLRIAKLRGPYGTGLLNLPTKSLPEIPQTASERTASFGEVFEAVVKDRTDAPYHLSMTPEETEAWDALNTAECRATLARHGWTEEEFDKAVEEEMDRFYAELDSGVGAS